MKINSLFWKNKRVLVTGHTGFKGAWLTALLNELNAKTAGFALAPEDGSLSLYDEGIRPTELDIIADIRDLSSVEKTITQFQPEIIFHMAAQALVLPSYEDPIGTFSTNIMGTAHVLMAALKSEKLRAVVNVTSDKCYENREWHWPYRETDPMGGHDPYSSSKGCAELVASSIRRSFYTHRELALPSVRAGNVIGGGDWAQSRIVPDLVRSFKKNSVAQIRNPNAIRPWQHVLEPLRAYLLIAQAGWKSPNAVSKGWNVGPDINSVQPVHHLAKMAARLWGNSAKFEIQEKTSQPHEATYLKLDTSLIRAEIGWQPALDFNTSMEWTIEWYRKFYDRESALTLCRDQIHQYLALDSSRPSE